MPGQAHGRVELPTGTVTFLFTDIQSSTLLLQLWGEEAYAQALDDHYAILRRALSEHGGVEVNTEGDALFAVFGHAGQAIAMAVSGQAELARHRWPAGAELCTRMGLHTGEASRRGNNYVGLAVHQGARVASAAHGGQIVASSATARAAGELENPLSWRPLGHHRLKDLGSPVELFQLCHPLVASEFPPLRSLERVAHNLPTQLSSFWGRAQELALGAKLLSSARLLTITGPGGSGKTRLAYQLAAEASSQFPDGVWVAELAPLARPELVPAAVMGSLGLRDEPSRSPTETVVNQLSGRCALLVMDNCEHVVSAAAAVADAVLKGCPQVRVLATSREPLDLPGETAWALGPLALPSATEGNAAILATSDAVALFCERAAEAQVGFHLNDANAAHVADICARLDGIPLALELAAARLRSLPLGELARRLSIDLGLLSKGPRRSQGSQGRQASLDATLDWSYQLLTLPEQVVFRQLAIFAGGFSLAAVEVVCSGPDLDGEQVDALDGLVSKSLVLLDADHVGEGRYRMLGPVRDYARQHLRDAGELELVAGRHAHFFSRLGQEIREQVASGANLVGKEVEHSNILAALTHLSEHGTASDHGRLVVDLWEFWNRGRHMRIGEREYRRYLARPDGELSCRVACARYLGNLVSYLGELSEARKWHAEALRWARELGDRRAEGTCLRNCGNDSFLEGHFAQAGTYYREALVIAQEIGDRTMEGRCAGGMGMAAAGQGHWPMAWSFYTDAVSIAIEVDDRLFETSWYNNRGEAAVKLGMYGQAEKDLSVALRFGEERQVRGVLTTAHNSLGELATNLGDYRRAGDHYNESLKLAKRTAQRRDASWSEGGLGLVNLKLGHYQQASQHLGAALDLAREVSDRSTEGHWLGYLGFLALEQGDVVQSISHCEQGFTLAKQVGNRDDQSLLLGVQGSLAARSGELGQARARFVEALDLTKQTGHRDLEIHFLAELGDVASRLDEHAEAGAFVLRSLSAAAEIGHKDSSLLDVAAFVLARAGGGHCSAGLLRASDAMNAEVGKVRGDWDQARYDDTVARCEGRLGPVSLDNCQSARGILDWAGALEQALSALERHLPASAALPSDGAGP